jgi:ubiquinone/menaquinone biosynthesis C-methylase UbiE
MLCCGPGCRAADNISVNAHYDADYFEWQAVLGRKKARQHNWRRVYGAAKNDSILDFGAGTGAILASLGTNVRRKIAVEFSDVARNYMRHNHPDIQLHKYPESVPSGSVSLVVSTSVIEHVECPVQELAELRRKLVPGGTRRTSRPAGLTSPHHPWLPVAAMYRRWLTTMARPAVPSPSVARGDVAPYTWRRGRAHRRRHQERGRRDVAAVGVHGLHATHWPSSQSYPSLTSPGPCADVAAGRPTTATTICGRGTRCSSATVRGLT